MEAERWAYIINEIKNNMDVEMVVDTIQIDRVYLTKWLGTLDDYNQKVNDYTSEALMDITRLERLIGNKKDFYAAKFEEERTTNPAIKALSSVVERTSATHYILRNLKTETLEFEHELRDAEVLHKMLENKQKAIASTMRTIKSQWEANCSTARGMFLGNRESADVFQGDPDAAFTDSLKRGSDTDEIQTTDVSKDSGEKKGLESEFDDFTF